MKANRLGIIRGLRPNPVPPPDSKPTGEVLPDGRLVYCREVDVYETQPVLGPDGEQRWRVNPQTGERLVPVKRRAKVGTRTQEFVLRPSPKGHVFIQTNFRESPDEVARRERRRKMDEFMSDLAGEAADRGLSAADVMNAARGVLAEDEEPDERDADGQSEPGEGALPTAEHGRNRRRTN